MYRYSLCRALLFLFLTILWLALAACGGDSGPPPGNGTIEDLSFRTLEAGEMSSITTAGPEVARTPAEIVAVEPQGTGPDVFWNETVPGANCPPGLPVVTRPYPCQ